MASHWPCVTDNTGNYHLRAHRTQTGRWAPRLFLRRRGTFIFTSTFCAGWHKIADTCFSHCVCFTAWFYTGSFDFFHLRSSSPCVSADFNWAISIGYSILLITSSSVDRFSKFFHRQTQLHMRNESFIKDPTKPQTGRYTTLWKVDVRKLPTIWNNVLFANNF